MGQIVQHDSPSPLVPPSSSRCPHFPATRSRAAGSASHPPKKLVIQKASDSPCSAQNLFFKATLSLLRQSASSFQQLEKYLPLSMVAAAALAIRSASQQRPASVTAAAGAHGHRTATAARRRRAPCGRLRALPPELTEILNPKLVPGSPSDTGDVSSLIPVRRVPLVYLSYQLDARSWQFYLASAFADCRQLVTKTDAKLILDTSMSIPSKLVN